MTRTYQKHFGKPMVGLVAIQKIEKTKKSAEREALGLPPNQSLLGSLMSWLCFKTSVWCVHLFCPCCALEPGGTVTGLFHFRRCNIFGSNKYLYELFKNVLAFTSGWLLAFIAALVMIYVFDYDPWWWMLYCGVVGFFISFLLWFFILFRCYIIVLIINILSDKSTWAIMIYAIYLTTTGPIENIKLNSQIVVSDLVCMIEVVLNNSRMFGDRTANPLNEAFKSIHENMDKLNQYSTLIKEGLNNILEMIRFFQAVLKRVVRICRSLKSLCTFFCDYLCQKCNTILLLPFRTCKRHIPAPFAGLCAPLLILDVMCVAFCIGRYVLCYAPEIFGHLFRWWISLAMSVIVNFASLFVAADFSLKVTWIMTYETIQSKSYKHVASEIFQEAFYGTVHFIESYIDLVLYFVYFLLFFICVDSVWYIYQYYYFDKHDNYIVNERVMEIDQRRRMRKRPTILPLRYSELSYYGVSGRRLSHKEKKGIKQKFMAVTLLFTLTLIIFLVDYLMWKIVQTYHDNMVHVKIISFALSVKVEGEGILAELYRDLLRSFTEVKNDKNLLAVCTTKPHEFSLRGLLRITIIYGFVYVSILLKPFLRRLRLRICDVFFPKRRLQRAVWLYSNILRRRIPLLKIDFDRVFYSQELRVSSQPSLLEKLAARFSLLGDLLSCLGYESHYCLMCGINGKPHDPYFYKCANYGCTGLYCEACFNETNKICPLCHRLITYDDEDVSEEMDSSDEEIFEDKRQIVRLSNMLNSGEPGQQNPEWSYLNQRNNLNSYCVDDHFRRRRFNSKRNMADDEV